MQQTVERVVRKRTWTGMPKYNSVLFASDVSSRGVGILRNENKRLEFPFLPTSMWRGRGVGRLQVVTYDVVAQTVSPVSPGDGTLVGGRKGLPRAQETAVNKAASCCSIADTEVSSDTGTSSECRGDATFDRGGC